MKGSRFIGIVALCVCLGGCAAGSPKGGAHATHNTAAPDILYTAADFTLRLPAQWQGAYACREEETGVVFFEEQNSAAGYGGELFRIVCIPAQQKKEQPAGFEKLAERDGAVWGYLRPTNVQFNDGDERLTQAYAHMSLQVEKVLQSFSLSAEK
ncbi:MAG: hypothetical protein PHD32_01655 [Eubacteriales bacterium]|nr:hypothetical protein [Eubacteriales bacterium]